MYDKHTVELTHKFCMQHLGQHGYRRLYLIGSRARGTAKPSSDHDFVALVEDGTPSTLLTGRNTQLQAQFAAYTSLQGLGKVDLLIATASRIGMTNPSPDDLIPYSCQEHGKIMWDQAVTEI